MATLGYFVFVVGAIVLNPIVGLVLVPFLMPVANLLGAIARRVSLEASRVVGAVFAGAVAGALLFGLAALIRWVFGSNSHWLVGLGLALTLASSPNVLNARYAVPAQAVLFGGLCLLLLL